MAWVTKSSTEEYQREAPPEYTKQQKAANWWHYHRLHLAVGAIVLILVCLFIRDTVFQIRPDYQVAYVARAELPVDTAEALTEALQQYGQDLNGDGRVVVQLNQYTLDFGSESSNDDAYIRMAGITRLSADISSKDGSYIFLLEDPQSFQEQTGALQSLDGELDLPAGAWTTMVYRWKDCPVLAGLNLGDYVGLTMLDDLTGSSQDLLANVYVARRGAWEEDQAEGYAPDAELWQVLTAGAVPMGDAR